MNENCRTELFPKARYSEDYAGYLVRRNLDGFKYPKAAYAFMWRNHFDLYSEKHIGSVYVNYQEDSEQESFFLYIYSERSLSRRYCTEIQITRDHPLPKDLEEKLLSAFRIDCFNDSIGQAGYLLRYMNDIQPMLQCMRNRYPDINNYRNEDTLLAVLPLVMYYIWNDKESVMGITCRDEKACFIAPYLGEFHELNTKEKTAENDKTVVGFLKARNMRTPYSGVLCFIFEEFRRQGYGTESMQLFLEIIKKRKTKVEWFCTGCKDDNQAAQALIESLGGVLDMADTLGGPQALHRYAIEARLEKEEDVRWFYSYSIPCR